MNIAIARNLPKELSAVWIFGMAKYEINNVAIILIPQYKIKPIFDFFDSQIISSPLESSFMLSLFLVSVGFLDSK
ncbi:hypothetical protein NHP164001_20740 [Helicobacter trogontum]|uniref:Uncharacterized protein n=1 Tax=Helicobacter trogontum TaxID=50960 RepID=A0ABQ0D6S4_9HELI